MREPLCHRCGATLVGEDTFCPVCGAPQLRIEEGAEGAQPFNAAQPQGAREAGEPAWKDGILAALTLAVPVGLLSSSLLPLAFLSSFWVMAGAVLAVNLYRRRARTALLNTRVGLRIGMVLGLVAALLTSAADGLLMAAQRYVFHDAAVPDKTVQSMIDVFKAPYAENAQAQVQLHAMFSALATPNGKAALVLFFMFSSAVSIFVFSIIGGALGAKLFSIRRISMRNS